MLEQAASGLTAREARAIAREAYVFGLPLVENYRLFAIDHLPDSPHFRPSNTWRHVSRLVTPQDRDVVTPNNDTLYSEACLDLRGAPVVIETPELSGRYFCIQLVDITTNNLPYIGTRETGTSPGRFVVVGPDWKGTMPGNLHGVPVIHSPSRFVLALLRIGVDGAEDVPAVAALQKRFRLLPFSEFSDGAPPPLPDVAWPPSFDPKKDETLRAFEYVNFMMQWHRFLDAVQPTLERFARIGVRAGERFDAKALPSDLRAAMLEGVKAARDDIRRPPPLQQGWALPDPKVGSYGDDYLLRAHVAWNYLYANSPEEAVYPITHRDAADQPLDGSTGRYVLRFPREALPPARYFWSVTAYDSRTRMLVENPLHRYSLGDRSRELKKSEDGSLSLFLQREAPEGRRMENWLPVPDGRFYVVLRIYGPTEEALRGPYVPPAIEAFSD